MEQIPSRKANSLHLWKMKFNYRVHNSVSFVPILSHIKSFEVLPAYFVKIHFNIILLCMPRFQNGLLLSGFPIKALYAFLFFGMCATFPANFILDLITVLLSGEEYFHITQFSPPICYFISFRPKYFLQHPILGMESKDTKNPSLQE